MKKIITLIAAAAMLAVSCQKETPATDNPNGSSIPGKLTATIVKTKVSYTENGNDLQPAWEIGDKIIGFDDAGSTYTLTVASVSAETATLSGSVPDGALHLIYKSGAQASDISAKTLAIDYKNQAGDKTMPAVMLADGTVTDGSCEFSFTNAGAIIGISAVKGVPKGSKVSKITVSGSNLSAATIALSGSALALTATKKANDVISVNGLDLTVTNSYGNLSAPVFIAVPAGAIIAKVSVKKNETMKIPSTAAEKKNIDYVEIEAKYDGTNLSTKKWAKWNVGANSQSEYGWYFAWAGTEGYVYKNDKVISADGIDTYSYSLSSAKTAGAGDYLYVKTQSFATNPDQYCFYWMYTPYQTQNATDSKSTKYTKYLGSTTSSKRDPSATDADALKTVLDPEDDAAHVNWGGTWRIPTEAEFKALKDATYWAYDNTDKGYYVFSPDASHSAGTRVNSVPSGLNKKSALLFFPFAGWGMLTVIGCQGDYGLYWSSTLDSSEPNYAYYLNLSSPAVLLHNNFRYYGMLVRPVSD